MGKRNIQRLKAKIGLDKDNNDVNECIELIDRVYYQNQGHTETFDDKTEVTTWFFEDGRRISLNLTEVTHVALFLMSLANDIDEQLMPLDELEKSYYLEENRWQKSK